MEFEADLTAMNTAYRTGYDPGGMIEVLQALKQAAPAFRFSYARPGQQADVEIMSLGERPALDMRRARDEFCFEPAYTLQQGIDSYLAWARENPETFRA